METARTIREVEHCTHPETLHSHWTWLNRICTGLLLGATKNFAKEIHKTHKLHLCELSFHLSDLFVYRRPLNSGYLRSGYGMIHKERFLRSLLTNITNKNGCHDHSTNNGVSFHLVITISEININIIPCALNIKVPRWTTIIANKTTTNNYSNKSKN